MPEIIRVDTSEIAGTIYKLEAKAKALSGLMPAFAEELVSAVSDVYEAEGPGWEPLTEYTIAHRRGTINKILQDTGVMAQSTAPGYGGDWAEAFAGASYADFHARGCMTTTVDENGVFGIRLPRRNPFDLGPFEAEVLESLADMAALEATK